MAVIVVMAKAMFKGDCDYDSCRGDDGGGNGKYNGSDNGDGDDS